MRLRALLAPALGRRRRAPRPEGPRTIVAPAKPALPAGTAAARVDAARARLRRRIPPRPEDD